MGPRQCRNTILSGVERFNEVEIDMYKAGALRHLILLCTNIYLYCAVHFMAQEDKLVIPLYFSDSIEVQNLGEPPRCYTSILFDQQRRITNAYTSLTSKICLLLCKVPLSPRHKQRMNSWYLPGHDLRPRQDLLFAQRDTCPSSMKSLYYCCTA